jgi:hypothetical protein
MPEQVNNYIKAYNALTKAAGGAPCYDPTNVTATGNAAGDCSNSTDIVNPYCNLPEQGLLNRTGWYDTFPNAPPEDAPAFAGPSAISPNFVLSQGQSYGAPTSIYGLDPRTCNANQATTVPNPNGGNY